MSNPKLKKIIKNRLMEHKRQVLTEEKIVRNRLAMVLEDSINNGNLNVDKLYDNLITEVSYLKEQGYSDVITENVISSFFNLLGGLIKTPVEGVVDTFKERIMRAILKLLGVSPDSWLSAVVTTAFGNIDFSKDFGKLFDCKFIASKIAEAIPESIAVKYQQSKRAGSSDGGLMGTVNDALRNMILDNVINDSQFMNTLEDRISDLICGFLFKTKENVTKAADDMSEKVKSSEE